MFQDKRVVIVTPAGRQRYLELLVPHIVALRPVVDEYRLWVNTINQADIAYMQELEKQYAGFIRLEYLPSGAFYNGNLSIHHFFKNTTEPNTIYVRFDDDIIYVDDCESFKDFLAFRLANPQYFLVYGNILNNAILSHLHQRVGNFRVDDGQTVGYACMDDLGWNDPYFAESIHRQILQRLSSDNNLKSFHMSNWVLFAFERVSINCICWLGSEFAKFNGEVGADEEQWLSVDKPKMSKMPNAIFGGFCCIHYGFYTQRVHLDTTDILKAYRFEASQKEICNSIRELLVDLKTKYNADDVDVCTKKLFSEMK